MNRNKSAFTLIELMLAIGIFSVIAAAAYSLLRTCIEAQRIGEENAQIQREAQRVLGTITNDLMATFTSARFFNTGFMAEDYADGELDRDILVFVTASHVAYPDPDLEAYGEMDLAQIGYYIPDESMADELGKRGLLRHENAILSWREEADEGSSDVWSKEWYEGEEREILQVFNGVEAEPVEIGPNVVSMNLKFYDGDDWLDPDDWQDSWDSTSEDNKLPEAVEVTIGVVKPRFRGLDEFSMDETMFERFTAVVRIPVAGSEPSPADSSQSNAETGGAESGGGQGGAPPAAGMPGGLGGPPGGGPGPR